jgi:hypothetical protein
MWCASLVSKALILTKESVLGELLWVKFFRGGCLESRETKTLFRSIISILVVFVVGMFIFGMFVLAIMLSSGPLSYLSVDFDGLLPILTFLGTLCSVSGAGLVV